ncbi:hypothetical protein GWK48_00915 [Metallosphaera tengchongensis]|uniref:Uncharacterized protein n=1 Tax=Metallosphaera tengchongensis TaxID=1532350 RepID=A0A6N0NSH6_9CREN|nr:hypothetical protein [Metallosphaera tengchongensis]QKQ99144.1 hypothetical protein GWK48_00915 [Metallosphaera tengchongensis]
MSIVYKYGQFYIAGVSHVVPGYLQDVVFISQKGERWDVVSAERFKSEDRNLMTIREAVKYVTHLDDLKKAVTELRGRGISLEEIRSFPFPKSLIEGKKKIQAEFD